MDPRRMEALASRLTVVRERIDAAARAAGRDPAELTLIAVSKTWPAADAAALCALGVRHFAENREQEAGPKVDAVRRILAAAGPDGAQEEHAPSSDGGAGHRPGLSPGTPGTWRRSRPGELWSPDPGSGTGVPVWHFVGQLQRNKARAVAGWAHWVQSVDRARLVDALAKAATDRGRVISVCVQVSLDPAEQSAAGAAESAGKSLPSSANALAGGMVPGGRGGARPEDVPALADLVAASEGLVLAGVMAVAPRGTAARPAFARLREVAERIRSDHPSATVVSAGMSGDLEGAVAEGATHLRIGTALFGERHGVP